MQDRIDFIVRKTEEVFNKYGIRTYLDSRTPLKRPIRGAKYITYGLVLENPTQLKKVTDLTEELAYACRCGNVIAQREKGVLWLQYELEEEYWINYSFDGKGIGMASGNKPITYDFLDSVPHCMVAGTTGSGKSELVKTILAYLMLTYDTQNLRIGLCDPNNDFAEFNGASHLIGPVRTSEESITGLVSDFYQELIARRESNNRNGTRLLLVIDEAQSDIALGDKVNGFTPNISLIKDILRQGRKYKINVLIATQKPTHTDLPGMFDLLLYRFVGRVADAAVSSKLTGQAGLEAHKLLGKGDFLKIDGSNITRFQAAYLQNFKTNKQQLPLPFINNSTIISSDIVPEVLAEYLRNEIGEKEAETRFGLPSGIHNKYVDFVRRLNKCDI